MGDDNKNQSQDQGGQTQTQGQQAGSQGQQQATPPTIDADALAAKLGETFRAEFTKFAEGVSQPVSEPDTKPDPMAKILAPYVGPAIQNVALMSQAAMDAATFYAPEPAASPDEDLAELKAKWRSDIEAKFNELLKVGQPVPRADIFQWLIGGPKRKEYMDWAMAKRQESAQRAQMAQTAGAGNFRGAAGTPKTLDQMTEQELEQLLSQGF